MARSASTALEVPPALAEEDPILEPADITVFEGLSLTLTLFEDSHATAGAQREVEWEELCELIEEPDITEGDPDAPAWCMVTFADNRRDAPIEDVHAIMLEYDAVEVSSAGFRRAWSRWAFAAFTDAAGERWRLVLPLSSPVDAEDYGDLLEWAQRRFTEARALNSADPSRPWPVPVAGDEYAFTVHAEGEPLDADEALEDLAFLRSDEARWKAVAALAERLEEDAPSLKDRFDLRALERGQKRRLISMAALPGWPQSPISGHGWGAGIDRLIGGGLYPGMVMSVSADTPEASEALVFQLADGLALRTAIVSKMVTTDPLSPVMLVTERHPEHVTTGSLARWTGEDRRIFRAGASASRTLGVGEARVNAAFDKARSALDGPISRAWDFVRVLDSALRGQPRVAALLEKVEMWRKLMNRQFSQETWPVVVVNPIASLEDGELSAIIAAARSRGWALLLAGELSAEHSRRVDVQVHLTRTASVASGEVAVMTAEVRTPSGAVGQGRFHWFPFLGRVTPAPPRGKLTRPKPTSARGAAPAPRTLDDSPTEPVRLPRKPAKTIAAPKPKASPARSKAGKPGKSLKAVQAPASSPAELLRSPRAKLRQSLREVKPTAADSEAATSDIGAAPAAKPPLRLVKGRKRKK